MKNLLLTIVFSICVLTFGFSQFTYGGGVQLAPQLVADGSSSLGIQGRVMYDVTETFAASSELTLFLGGYLNWAIDFDLHYKLMDIGEAITLYPMAGVGIVNKGYNGVFGIPGNTSTEFGVNVGVFATYNLADKWLFYVEPKLNIGGYGDIALSAGALF